ncbi:MAG: hypothetical protein IJB86_06090 [Clostridia bacterium]|nr:hypothetical protein [Clostridia bacterium]
MEDIMILVNDYLLQNAKTPLICLAVVCVVILVLTVIFVGRELKKRGNNDD